MPNPRIYHHPLEHFQYIEFAGELTPRNFYLIFHKTAAVLRENNQSFAYIEAHPQKPSQAFAKISLVQILDDLEFSSGIKIAWVTFTESAHQSAKDSEIILNGRGLFLAKAFQSTQEALEWFEQDIAIDNDQEGSSIFNHDETIKKIVEMRKIKNIIENH